MKDHPRPYLAGKFLGNKAYLIFLIIYDLRKKVNELGHIYNEAGKYIVSRDIAKITIDRKVVKFSK